MNTLRDLEEIFNTTYIYVGVAVKLPNLEQPEIIINPIENYAEKLKYYKNAYTDDLKLKANNEIEIVGAYASDYADDIMLILQD
jgi:hypothetical protein